VSRKHFEWWLCSIEREYVGNGRVEVEIEIFGEGTLTQVITDAVLADWSIDVKSC
jgi:hypothetical protein